MKVAEDINLDQVPGLQPPPGIKPKFENPPESFQNVIIATLVICQTMATFVVGIRILSHAMKLKSVGIEDRALHFPIEAENDADIRYSQCICFLGALVLVLLTTSLPLESHFERCSILKRDRTGWTHHLHDPLGNGTPIWNRHSPMECSGLTCHSIWKSQYLWPLRRDICLS